MSQHLKIAVFGKPGAGISEYMRLTARRFGDGKVRLAGWGPCRVFRASLQLPLEEGRKPLQASIYAMEGVPNYEAIWELFLRSAGAVIFCARLSPDHAAESRNDLATLAREMIRAGQVPPAFPFVLQYDHGPDTANLTADEFDRHLNIRTGDFARVETSGAAEDSTHGLLRAIPLWKESNVRADVL